METRNDTKDTRSGWPRAAAGLLAGAAGCAALVLLCSEPANDGPVTWGFILVTKVGGLALLALTGWIYDRFISTGGDGDDDRA